MLTKSGALVAVAVAAAAALVAGCSSSSKSTSTPTTASSGTSPTTSSSATTAGSTTNSGSSAPGVTATSIKIGLISDFTGGLSSSFADTNKGVRGYFNMVNAAGGIDGRKLTLVTADDASTPSQGLTAAQSLESQGVFAIINISGASPIDSYQYMNSAGIPVVGSCYDGPEWSGAQSNNMFSWNGCNGQDPSYDTLGQYLKQQGVTKLAVVGYGQIPSSKANVLNYSAAAKALGIPTVYEGFGVTPGQVNFSPEALAIKSTGANGVVAAMAEASDLGLSNAIAAIGDQTKAQLYAGVGYDEQTLSDPTTKASAQGDSFTVLFKPVETNSPADQQFVSELKQYANYTGIPGFAIASGWFSAAMLVAGLKSMGSTPLTRSSYITAMHALSGFSGGGVLPSTINEATDWGQGADGQDPNSCVYVVKLSGSAFIPQNGGNAYCGKFIPGQNTGTGTGPTPQPGPATGN
jgi:branched-chain amino acid transport system substrate-binding protein